jgi:hypothetical protein
MNWSTLVLFCDIICYFSDSNSYYASPRPTSESFEIIFLWQFYYTFVVPDLRLYLNECCSMAPFKKEWFHSCSTERVKISIVAYRARRSRLSPRVDQVAQGGILRKPRSQSHVPTCEEDWPIYPPSRRRFGIVLSLSLLIANSFRHSYDNGIGKFARTNLRTGAGVGYSGRGGGVGPAISGFKADRRGSQK